MATGASACVISHSESAPIAASITRPRITEPSSAEDAVLSYGDSEVPTTTVPRRRAPSRAGAASRRVSVASTVARPRPARASALNMTTRTQSYTDPGGDLVQVEPLGKRYHAGIHDLEPQR